MAPLGLASLGVAQSPWSPGPLVSILWLLVAACGRLEILPITASGASEKLRLLQITIVVGFLKCYNF